MIEKICKGCGEKFKVPNCHSKKYIYCSLKCRSKYKRGENHPNFGKSMPYASKNLGEYSKSWNKEDEEYVIKNHDKIPISIISKKIGKKEKTIWKWMKRRNLKSFYSIKGNNTIPWNKGKKGVMPIPWDKGKKRPEMSGEKHHLFGKHHTEETKRKISENTVRAIKISNSQKGKPKSEEHKLKMSKSMKGRKAWNKIYLEDKNIIKLYEKDRISPKKIAKDLNVSSSKIYDILNKYHIKLRGVDKEVGKKISITRKRKISSGEIILISPKKDTSIEIKIQSFLKQLGIDFFTHQYMKIEHGYRCDILIPSMNLIIECDGDAFHFNPILYKKEDRIFKEGLNAEEKWKLDYIRTKELQDKGFKVLRLWERDIKKMDIDTFKEILNLYKDKINNLEEGGNHGKTK